MENRSSGIFQASHRPATAGDRWNPHNLMAEWRGADSAPAAGYLKWQHRAHRTFLSSARVPS